MILEIAKQTRFDIGLSYFVAESNRIEGIRRDPSLEEIRAHRSFIARKRVTVQHVVDLVAVCQGCAVLRATEDVPGVRVGKHVAPPSGPKIEVALDILLKRIRNGDVAPWAAHVEYETLHPFTDGNGRSGRAIWLWHMTLIGQQEKALAIGFLHNFYYPTLSEVRVP